MVRLHSADAGLGARQPDGPSWEKPLIAAAATEYEPQARGSGAADRLASGEAGVRAVGAIILRLRM
jgi:hypothetical protein